MKRTANNKKQTIGLQKSAPAKTDSGTVALTKARELLVDELKTVVRNATGSQHFDVASRIIDQVSNTQVFPKPLDSADHFHKAIAAITEMAPQNMTEAMLSVQMIATHEAALMFLRRATTEGQSFESTDANVHRATRLMRIFLEQLNSMAKLKGKGGQQKVTVEHVHVYQGGQAIVGAVSPAKTTSEEGLRDATGAS